ncbi:MAG: hypothetical protein AAFQ84_03410 [Pseudomonadota bacterium]
MDQGKICAIALGVLGGWLALNTGYALMFAIRNDFPMDQLVESAIRMFAAIAALISGISSLKALRVSAWFAGISAFVMAVLTFFMIVLGADKSLWQDEIIYLFMMTALFLGMMVSRSRALAAEAAGAKPAAQ